MSNKWRYWLGLRTLCKHRGAYVLTRKEFGVFRVYFDSSDGGWWSCPYSGSYFDTPEEAMESFNLNRVVPV